MKKGVRKAACQGVDMGGTHTAAIKLIGLTTVPTMVWMDVHGLNAVQESVRLLPTHEGLGGMPSRSCVSVATPQQIRGRREHQQRRGSQVFVLRCGVSAHLSRPPGAIKTPVLRRRAVSLTRHRGLRGHVAEEERSIVTETDRLLRGGLRDGPVPVGTLM